MAAIIRHLARGHSRSRAFIASLGLTIWLAACAGLSSNGEPDKAQHPAQTPQRTEDSVRAQREVLVPWQIITGGRLVTEVDANGFPMPDSIRGYTSLVFPSALAVRGPDLYIADSGVRKLYRFDSSLQTLSAVPDVIALPWTRLQVGVDHSLFVLDAGNSNILNYTRGGNLLQRLSYPLANARISGFVVGEPLGKIIVSDQVNKRLVELHFPGNAFRFLGPVALDEYSALGEIAASGRKMYALDLNCPCIVDIDEEGRVRERFGQGELKQPSALAVDRNGQVFVADTAERTLKIFLEGMLIASYKAQALGITEISALAVDEGVLYVADGPGAKVVTLHILTPEKRKKQW